MNAPLVILGWGYTGRFVTAALSTMSRPFLASSRTPERNLLSVPRNQRLQFDLAQPTTWPHVPPQIDLLWCFPAVPIELVRRFAESANLSARRVVVLGSTSAYDMDGSAGYPPPWLDETAPIDLDKPRVRGEEFLRKECGAIVLRVAGIYGPGRNPLDWIRDGRVGPSRKYVNLIHVEDLAAVCLAALERGKSGEVYNVSDGTPHTWQEICQVGQAKWTVTGQPQAADSGETGKRIAATKLTNQLGISLRYPDLFEALRDISAAAS